MSRSYWLPIIAVVGWIGISLTADAQHATSPTLESKPITATQKPDSAGGHQDAATKKDGESEKLLPALKQIESAICDTIPKEDETKDKRQEDRDNADLKAQQDKASWAMWMLIATTASVAATFVGIALIARTLYHTRRAADYAKEMVVEAKAAATAATTANENTLTAIQNERMNAKRQLRAYASIDDAALGWTESLENLQAQIAIKNFGQTPVRSVRHAFKANLGPLMEVDMAFNPIDESLERDGGEISPGQTREITVEVDPIVTDQQNTEIAEAKQRVYLWGYFRYTDIFDEEYRVTVQRNCIGLPLLEVTDRPLDFNPDKAPRFNPGIHPDRTTKNGKN